MELCSTTPGHLLSVLRAVALQREEKQQFGPQRNPIEALSGVKAVQSEIDAIIRQTTVKILFERTS